MQSSELNTKVHSRRFCIPPDAVGGNAIPSSRRLLQLDHLSMVTDARYAVARIVVALGHKVQAASCRAHIRGGGECRRVATQARASARQPHHASARPTRHSALPRPAVMHGRVSSSCGQLGDAAVSWGSEQEDTCPHRRQTFRPRLTKKHWRRRQHPAQETLIIGSG